MDISFSENALVISFQSEIDDQYVNTNVTVYDEKSDTRILSYSFNLDRGINSFKLGVHKSIIETAINLKKSSEYKNWTVLDKTFTSFVEHLSLSSKFSHVNSELLLSSFYHLAIYKSIVRSSESFNCNCTPMPSYIVGKSPFWCQEDRFYDIEELYSSYLENYNELITIPGGKEEFDFLKERRMNHLSVSRIELFELHHSKQEFIDNMDYIFDIAQSPDNQLKNRDDCVSKMYGSDLGCCGNYEGCCWYSSMACFRHDLACLTCEKLHCGPACQPEF